MIYSLRYFSNIALFLVFAFWLQLVVLVRVNAVEQPQLKKSQQYQIKDYGVLGQLFKIAEKSLLEEIKEKLELAEKDGRLGKLQEEFNNRVKSRVMRPVAVAGIGTTRENRQWTWNPTYYQKDDITDGRGSIVVRGGTSINPLDKLSWGEPLLFINGDDEDQIAWVKQQRGRIVLVKGAPLEVSQKLGRDIYFDQGGIYTRKFNIENVPAIVKQQDRLLLVREVRI